MPRKGHTREQSFHKLEAAMDRLQAHVDPADRGRHGQPVGPRSPARHAARDGQPQISELERHLEVRLLNRSSRRIAPTDAGRSYVAACGRILEEVEQAERSVAGEYRTPKGDLAITAPIVFGRVHVLPIVVAFLAGYP